MRLTFICCCFKMLHAHYYVDNVMWALDLGEVVSPLYFFTKRSLINDLSTCPTLL